MDFLYAVCYNKKWNAEIAAESAENLRIYFYFAQSTFMTEAQNA